VRALIASQSDRREEVGPLSKRGVSKVDALIAIQGAVGSLNCPQKEREKRSLKGKSRRIERKDRCVECM